MDPEKVKILIASIQLFKQYGVKSVTMDQISSHLGISKKTLYKFVSNKKDLLDQVFEMAVGHMKERFESIFSDFNGNAIDKLFALERFAEENLRGEEDRLMDQLKQYYPELAARVFAAREALVNSFTVQNLKEGIEEGLYREDVNIEYISIIYYGHVLAVHESIVHHRNVNVDGLRKASLRYHIRGIASQKGLIYLNQNILNTHP
jgi:AcrR family transcriptional regulator